MSKRGRPRLPRSEVKCVRVTVRLTEATADGMFQLSGRNRLTLSAIIQNYCDRLLAREKSLVSDQIQQIYPTH